MTLVKNRHYALNMNGKTYVQKYVGKFAWGFKFVTDNSGACIFMGAGRLAEADPKFVEKKVAKKFLGIK